MVAFGCFSIAKEREFRRRSWVWGQHHQRVGEEPGRAVSLLIDDRVSTKIAGTGEEKVGNGLMGLGGFAGRMGRPQGS